MRLLSRLFSRVSGRFRPYEEALLNRWLELLPADARAIAEQQIAAVTRVQRSALDKFVLITVDETDLPLFVNRSNEVYAARITVQPAGLEPVICTITVALGRLSALEFSVPPAAALSRITVEMDARLLKDLQQAPRSRPLRAGAITSPCLIAARRIHPLKKVKAPLAEQELQELIDTIGAPVPADYLALLQETSGFLAGDWEFYGPDYYRLVRTEATYIVAAENTAAEDSSSLFGICFVEGATAPRAVVYNLIDDEAVAEHATFMEALLTTMQAPPGP
jgi:hypothetical protein